MKSVLVGLCLLMVFVWGNPIQERYDQVHKKCQSVPELYVDDAIFEKLKKGESPALPPNFGDHAFCMLQYLDLQDEDGEVLESGVRKAVEQSNPENLEEIVKECSSIDTESEEDTALALFGCLGKNRINIGQL